MQQRSTTDDKEKSIMKPRNKSTFHGITLIALLAVLIGSAAFPTSALAFGATITVTSILDNNTTDGYCSLREAITNANNNAATSPDCAPGVGGDAIVFSNLLVVYTITLGSTLPAVSDPAGLIIYGDDNFTVSGNNLYRVFIVGGSASLTLDGLTVENGRSVSSVGGGAFNAGGTLTLVNCFFSGNSAIGSFGGGIYNVGTLTITDSIFSNNGATYVGSSGGRAGAVYNAVGSTATLTRTLLSGNDADIRGGGIYNLGTMTITDSTLSNNTMSSPGDGGGVIYNDQGALTITHSTFTGNAANSSGSNGGGIFNSLGTLTITRSTFSSNSVTTGVGGAIATNGTATIANSTFSSNYADFGAGIYNGLGGTLSATNNTFSGNSTYGTVVVGGGIDNVGILNLYNNILANSIHGGDCTNVGTIVSSNNLIESTAGSACGLTNGVNGNIIGSDPNLAAATLINPVYFPLNLTSLAINVGDDSKCAAAAVNNTSQNGLARPQGAHCEIGSYETLQTFIDVVPANSEWLEIEILYANGLTAGCSATPMNFCPSQIMDRAQAAVFNLRGNFGLSYTPPAAPWDRFADDWSTGAWAEKWAEGMYNAGFTAGCATSPLRYCPWDLTTKVQAAVFGLRLKYGNAYAPPAATGTVFFDMTDTAYFGTKWAEKAYADGLLPNCGINAGSGKPLFCPDFLVSRGQAAYMVVRAKNLTMP
jgi:CSLREA domain-containing protein